MSKQHQTVRVKQMAENHTRNLGYMLGDETETKSSAAAAQTCVQRWTNIEENTQTPRNVTEVSFDIKET